ncbi:phosphoglycerate kinase [Candidatus Micrarchaeota archaeon CG1_02_55_22]|nr:MAG: phosphoglycerate kinase [Candidatus Micrarchaeota archaeon CG1_02_55_22]
MTLNTLDNYKTLRGKTVLLRIDLNSAFEGKKIVAGPRFDEHAKTVALLAKQGAKVVILAHQGRKGDDDFTSLKKHAEALCKLTNIKVGYSADAEVVSEKTLALVRGLKPGQVLLLDNLRYLDEETMAHPPYEHSQGKLVSALAPLADLYVNDAFSMCHRAHESIVGFPEVLASAAGPTLEHEIEAARKAREQAAHPCVYVLGGNKPKEAIGLMRHALKKVIVDKILLAGVIGELCMIARGNEVPAPTRQALKDAGHLEYLLELRDLIHKYHEFLETPFDFIVEGEDGEPQVIMLTKIHDSEKPIGDIGPKTATKFSKIIMRAKTVYMKGPPGRYEQKVFEKGTKTILEAVAKTTAYTLVGGGHSSSALKKEHIALNRFSYVSLSGGALQEFLAGKDLPGITALERSEKRFGATFGFHAAPKPKPVVEKHAHKTPAVEEIAAEEPEEKKAEKPAAKQPVKNKAKKTLVEKKAKPKAVKKAKKTKPQPAKSKPKKAAKPKKKRK